MEQKKKYRRVIRQLIGSFRNREEVSSLSERSALWQEIVRDVQYQKKLAQQRRLRLIFTSTSVAAVLGGLIWLGGQYLFTQQQQDIVDIASRALALNTVDEAEIRLVISGDQVINLKEGATVSYSSSGSVRVDDKAIANVNQQEEYNQIIVPKGKFTRLVLADGSNLYINAGTKVVYPRQFKENLREIFVDGEIYIDVKPNESAPFFVKTANFEVEVLGTAFNVSAYSEEKHSEVVLVRGSVKIKDQSKKEMQLEPNQLASLRAGEFTGKGAVDASVYILWTQGLLNCNAEPLGYLLRKLERYYGIEISCDSAVESLLMNGNLDLNCPLEEVLRRISITAPIHYQKVDSGYVVHAN